MTIENKIEVVRNILNDAEEAQREYCEENSDHADAYGYIIGETSYEWAGHIEKWLDDNYDGPVDSTVLAKAIAEEMDSDDCEAEINRSDYDGYSGSGCCIFGSKIGESEESVEIANFSELEEYHDDGILDDILDELDSDFCIRRSCRRERNEDTGHYEAVGRKSYNPYNHEHPSIDLCVDCSGGWDFVVSAERMGELLTAGIISLARRTK